jgi:hypothetical protein
VKFFGDCCGVLIYFVWNFDEFFVRFFDEVVLWLYCEALMILM